MTKVLTNILYFISLLKLSKIDRPTDGHSELNKQLRCWKCLHIMYDTLKFINQPTSYNFVCFLFISFSWFQWPPFSIYFSYSLSLSLSRSCSHSLSLSLFLYLLLLSLSLYLLFSFKTYQIGRKNRIFYLLLSLFLF